VILAISCFYPVFQHIAAAAAAAAVPAQVKTALSPVGGIAGSLLG
jgi:hypothetical protein